LDIAIFLVVTLEEVGSGGRRSIAEAFRRRPGRRKPDSSGSMHEKV